MPGDPRLALSLSSPTTNSLMYMRNVPAYFTFGVLQLAAVARRLVANLAGHAPLLVGPDQISFVDIDDTMNATYGYAKQGAGYG